MDTESTKELQKKIYKYESALEDLLDISKMYSGHAFNVRLNNMIITRFPELAEKLELKEIEVE